VVSLGPCVPDELLISECLRIRPGLIVVSSVNRHASIDGIRLIGRIRRCPELVATDAEDGLVNLVQCLALELQMLTSALGKYHVGLLGLEDLWSGP
jgi:hypothetical protein